MRRRIVERGITLETRAVGTSDVRLSVIGLGGAWVGNEPDDASEVARATAVLRASDEAGINWLDTSENYFGTGNESVIGLALRALPEDFLVCSKAAPGALASGGGTGFRPEEIRRACEASLQRIGRDHLDVYLLHWPDDTGVPLADTWGAMAGLADDGLVRSIGLSNYERDDIDRCHRQRPVDVIQTGLSLLDYLEDRPMIAWCGEQGIAVQIYEPLASGILTDATLDEVRARWAGTAWEDASSFQRMLSPGKDARTTAVVDGLRPIAAQLGATVAQVALAWVLRQPGVTTAIAGSGNPDRTRSNARAADLDLSPDVLRAIDDLVPLGPAFA